MTIVAVPGVVTTGTPGNDVIMGSTSADTIRAGGGNDRVCSGGGDDVVFGQAGNDRINLGAGDDTARGGAGSDLILGKGGADDINGNDGPDNLVGGSGPDTLRGGKQADDIAGGAGHDGLFGNAGNDALNGGRGIDDCVGGAGSDTLRSCNEPGLRPGTHRVGSDIKPGRYEADARFGCYWERLSGLGGTLGEIIANDFQTYRGRAIVDVMRGDVAFSFDSACGRFRPYIAPSGPTVRIRPGAHVVGVDIRPGTYQTQASSSCYWERRRDFGGDLFSIIANDFMFSGGQAVVSIAASDEGFFTVGECGTWTRVGP